MWQVQSGVDRGEFFVQTHGMSDEGCGQQPNVSEIHQNRLSVLVDAKVTEIHVGLGEHEAITGYHDGGMPLLGVRREQCSVRLAQVAC